MKIRCVKSCSTVRPIERGWTGGQEYEVEDKQAVGLLLSPNFEEVKEERSQEYKTREMNSKQNGKNYRT